MSTQGNRRIAITLGWGASILICAANSQKALSWSLPEESPLWQTAGVPLDQKRPISPHSTIRVKIFPHKVDYPPHGRDHETHQVTMSSSNSCQLYRGRQGRALRYGTPLRSGKVFSFSAAQLQEPAYLHCRGVTTLERAAGVPSYRYLGSFYLHRNQDGAIEVVNLLGLHQYLRGVVPSEVFSNWPMEALKTQAVAARTYSVFHLSDARRRGRRYFDVDDTIAYQAYTGVSLITSRTDRAIRETSGEILTFGDSVIQAYYHADSGGQTEDAENVWSMEVPYCESRVEAFDSDKPTNLWKKRFSLSQVTARLRARGLILRRDRVEDVVVPAAGRTSSGRVKQVAVRLKSGEAKVLSFRDFAKAMGRLHFQSTLFDIEKLGGGQTLEFSGRGFGHGVGMNQMGAMTLAQENAWNYQQILHFYYSSIQICQLQTKTKNTKQDIKGCYPGPEIFKPKRTFTGNQTKSPIGG